MMRWLPFYFIVFIFYCSKTGKNEQIVARFGDDAITLNQFRIGYLNVLKQPNVKDSKKNREAYLEELINRRILAEEAKHEGIEKDEQILFKVAAFKNHLLRKAHYQEVIVPHIIITDTLVKQVYLYTQEERRIKHLYFSDSLFADKTYRRLVSKPARFDSLLTEIMTDTLPAVAGADLGWVSWDQMAYEMAETAFRQPVNEITQPIKSTFGFHIIKVANIRRNVFASANDFFLKREYIENLLRQKQGETIAFHYIDKMMRGIKVQIKAELFDFVYQWMQKNKDKPVMPFASDSDFLPKRYEINFVEAELWQYREEPLLYINGEPVSLETVLSIMAYIPHHAIDSGKRLMLNYIIRDLQLTKEALKMNLENKYPQIEIEMDLYQEFLLQQEMRREIISHVAIDRDEIKDFVTRLMPSNQMVSPVKIDTAAVVDLLLKQKRTYAVPEFLAKRKRRFKMEKYPDVIHAFYQKMLN